MTAPGAYQLLLDRLLTVVDDRAYLTPAVHVEPGQRDAMAMVERAIQSPSFDPANVRALIQRLHTEGRIDRVMMLSAMHVVAAHPSVADWAEAARLAGEQEQAALELGGPNLSNNLAAVARHRAWLAFTLGQYSVALDYCTRALEHQHTVENLGNVLCVLVRLGEEEQAALLVERVYKTHPESFTASLERRIEADPDLAVLRTSELLS